jgi:hypothetical protein
VADNADTRVCTVEKTPSRGSDTMAIEAFIVIGVRKMSDTGLRCGIATSENHMRSFGVTVQATRLFLRQGMALVLETRRPNVGPSSRPGVAFRFWVSAPRLLSNLSFCADDCCGSLIVDHDCRQRSQDSQSNEPWCERYHAAP